MYTNPWSRLLVPFLIVLFTLVAFFVLVKLFGPIPFAVTSVTSAQSDLFTVEGTGKATAVPDTANIDLGVSKSASTVEAAKDEVNTVMNALTKDLKGLGIEEKDIKTTSYTVTPDYNYTTGTQQIKGYTVAASVSVTVKPTDKANQAIDIATKDGANAANGVNFTLNDEEQQQLEDTARKEAISNAKTKAESIARAAGIHLGRLVNVQENNATAPQPVFAAQKAVALPDSQTPTELSPGQNTVSITVTLSYQTY